MTAKLWQQRIANPQEWKFGTHQQGNNIPTTHNAPAVAKYTPHVPPSLTNAPVNFRIDLYQIQQLVLRMQKNQ
ncbi:hypothetical protein Glove_208g72 [Diversispora epigaea]|uniref:Uncharacterized protein n=1 Tax=Diversispora epigaea TaxID=1348612 RepID=A0A397IS65_9GLOM|nr:hypothetical protein Glove_208g72 [Diversispora epigaea]